MESSSFYLTLPSNASMDVFPNNTSANYQIRLPRTLYLKNNYEVALAEIHYPHSWHTFRDTDNYYITFQSTGEDFTVLRVTKGFYNDIQELISQIHKELLQLTKIENQADLPVRFGYNKITRQVVLRVKSGFRVNLGWGLAEMFGFRPNVTYTKNKSSIVPADILHGFYSLFVYCNICEPQIVGDYYVPLLRAVKIEGEDGDHLIKVYNQLQYVPVNTSKFDVIEINIKDDQDQNVPFTSGKVICKLHFRQKAF